MLSLSMKRIIRCCKLLNLIYGYVLLCELLSKKKWRKNFNHKTIVRYIDAHHKSNSALFALCFISAQSIKLFPFLCHFITLTMVSKIKKSLFISLQKMWDFWQIGCFVLILCFALSLLWLVLAHTITLTFALFRNMSYVPQWYFFCLFHWFCQRFAQHF